MTAPLVLERLTVGYPRGWRSHTTILADVDASVEAGEFVALVGPNGAGKSTLLRSVAGLQKSFGGRVLLDGDDTATLSRSAQARRLAVVLTDRFDAERLTVREVVGMGRHPHSSFTGRLDKHDREVVEDSLAEVGASALADSELNSLSDGQRQRVMVARALAQEPSVLLLDEPTSFLDPPGRVSLMRLVRRLCTARQLAAVVCTHDIEGVLHDADTVWVAGRDQSLVCGAPEDLALDGRLMRPFETVGVDFDLSSFTFRPARDGLPPAQVEGSGTAALLARRCLLRAGFDPDARDDDGVDVRVEADGERWTLHHASLPSPHRHDSLRGLHADARRLCRHSEERRP